MVEGFHAGYITTTVTSPPTSGAAWSRQTGRADEFVVEAGKLGTANVRGYLIRMTSGRAAGEVRHVWATTGDIVVADADFDGVVATGDRYVITGFVPPVTNGLVGGTVTKITDGGRTLTLSGPALPTTGGGLSGSLVRIVDGVTGGGQYRTVASNTATTLTVLEAWQTSGLGAMGVGSSVAVLEIPGVVVPTVVVNVGDNDTAGVLIEESDGTTRLVEGGRTDTITVRLTKAPTTTVVVNLTPQVSATGKVTADGIEYTCNPGAGCTRQQVTLSQSSVTFDATNWWIPVTVTLTAIADGIVDGGVIQEFAPQARRVTSIQGPLYVDGGDDHISGLNLALDGYLPWMLPGEDSGHPDPIDTPEGEAVEAKQVDRLIVHNEDGPQNDVGQLTSSRITGLGMTPDRYVAGRLFPGGITYGSFEDLSILLGYGDDRFTVETTHRGTTTLDLGAGNDTLTIRTLDGHTLVRVAPATTRSPSGPPVTGSTSCSPSSPSTGEPAATVWSWTTPPTPAAPWAG